MTDAANAKPKDPKLPWYKWYVYDWRGDETVRLLDVTGKGCYRELLDLQWIEGSIPADPDDLATIVGLSEIVFREKVWPKIAKKFSPSFDNPERLINLKLNAERTKAFEEVLAKAEAGRASGEARRRKKAKRGKRKKTKTKAADEAVNTRSTRVEQVLREPEPDIETEPEVTTTTPSPDTAPARGRPKKETWLTPFDNEWKETHGGTPFLKKGAKTGGELGKWLKIVKREIAVEGIVIEKDQLNEMFLRWRSFLKESGVYATPAKFSKEHGLHKGGKFVGGHDVRRAQPRPDAARPGRVITPTVGPGSAK